MEQYIFRIKNPVSSPTCGTITKLKKEERIAFFFERGFILECLELKYNISNTVPRQICFNDIQNLIERIEKVILKPSLIEKLLPGILPEFNSYKTFAFLDWTLDDLVSVKSTLENILNKWNEEYHYYYLYIY